MRDSITANQVIAYNLRRARTELNLTQEQVAQRLEEWLGVRWSSASFSLAERSYHEGTRRREFDANELLALSEVFHRPVGWFFDEPADAPPFIRCDDQGDAPRRIGRGQLRAAAGMDGGVDRFYIRAEVKTARDALDRLDQLTR